MPALDARKAEVFEVVAEEAAAFFQSYAVARLRMPSRRRLHVWCQKEPPPMQLGDMGGGKEELAVFGGSEDVGDLRGIEAVWAKEFEECGAGRAESEELREVEGFYPEREVGEARRIGLDEAGTEGVEIFVEDGFGVAKTLDVGLHSGVDGGVEIAQQGHELEADAVAAGVEFAIGDILDKGKVIFGHIAVDVGPRETEQRPDDPQIFIPHSQFRDRADAVEAGDASATEEVEEEGLDGVVAVMGRSDKRLVESLIA